MVLADLAGPAVDLDSEERPKAPQDLEPEDPFQHWRAPVNGAIAALVTMRLRISRRTAPSCRYIGKRPRGTAFQVGRTCFGAGQHLPDIDVLLVLKPFKSALSRTCETSSTSKLATFSRSQCMASSS